jgi:hypothetical protein
MVLPQCECHAVAVAAAARLGAMFHVEAGDHVHSTGDYGGMAQSVMAECFS